MSMNILDKHQHSEKKIIPNNLFSLFNINRSIIATAQNFLNQFSHCSLCG